ncbi:hypothetical protein TNCT_81811 [Trichonephila clavata]|uniref:Uncharacterized protein n=1 Tax=Trichonephila clavata TaxID=2740835 RepID=A0A8X6G1N3_TRICU|nr:hypothetical protein TNCT_81811 [Trichonephila clavata]
MAYKHLISQCKVISVMEQCMSDASKAEGNSTHSVKEFCEQLTHVPEWVAKHTNPPPQLTRVRNFRIPHSV